MVGKFFGVILRVILGIAIRLFICALCVLSLAICIFIIINVIPAIIKILGYGLCILGLIILIGIFIYCIIYEIRKGILTWKFLSKHNLTAKEAWEKVNRYY